VVLAITSLVVASDLQGVARMPGGKVLSGETVVEYLELLYALHFPALASGQALALRCGDLYPNPAKRGESGNPFRVWEAFSRAFGCTIGIAGNHDDFGADLARVQALPRAHFLARGTAQAHGLRLAGLSGIIGRPDKNFRLAEGPYVQAVAALLRQAPHVLRTHLSPGLNAQGLQGDVHLAAALAAANVGAVRPFALAHSRAPSAGQRHAGAQRRQQGVHLDPSLAAVKPVRAIQTVAINPLRTCLGIRCCKLVEETWLGWRLTAKLHG